MSSWAAVFESFHSALIDEVIEYHPEPKPELGMPIRQSSFELPYPSLNHMVMQEIVFLHRVGYVGLALDPTGVKAIGKNLEELWNGIVQRAKKEMSIRKVDAKLGKQIEVHELKVTRLVWIPLEVAGGKCFLAFGT